MATEHEVSAFRVEKTRSHAILTLSTGKSVRGCFFVAASTARGSGVERVSDLLNAERGLFPFEVHGDGRPRTVLYNRDHLVITAVADNEASRDPGYEVATRRSVSVGLSNGQRVVGSVRVYRPEGRDRLSDWGRQGDQFRYLETDDMTFILNVAHVIDVREVLQDE
jgi:hypothetical protein